MMMGFLRAMLHTNHRVHCGIHWLVYMWFLWDMGTSRLSLIQEVPQVLEQCCGVTLFLCLQNAQSHHLYQGV